MYYGLSGTFSCAHIFWPDILSAQQTLLLETPQAGTIQCCPSCVFSCSETSQCCTLPAIQGKITMCIIAWLCLDLLKCGVSTWYSQKRTKYEKVTWSCFLLVINKLALAQIIKTLTHQLIKLMDIRLKMSGVFYAFDNDYNFRDWLGHRKNSHFFSLQKVLNVHHAFWPNWPGTLCGPCSALVKTKHILTFSQQKSPQKRWQWSISGDNLTVATLSMGVERKPNIGTRTDQHTK